MPTVYVSDLDGTLLQDDATLSGYARDVLRALLNEGLLFTVATARSIASIRPMLSALTLPLPIIEFNGAFVSDLASGRHRVINSIEPAVVEDIYSLVKASGSLPFVSTFDGVEDRLYYNQVINEGMEWYVEDREQHGDGRLRHINDLTRSFRDEVVCLTIIGPARLLSELERAIKASHGNVVETHRIENRYSPGWHWLTVHDQRATKDQAIRIMLEQSGLEGSELVVFGDSSNDVRMFQQADRAIAVANATDQLKQCATHVIGPNAADSVVRFIRRDWSNRPRS